MPVHQAASDRQVTQVCKLSGFYPVTISIAAWQPEAFLNFHICKASAWIQPILKMQNENQRLPDTGVWKPAAQTYIVI